MRQLLVVYCVLLLMGCGTDEIQTNAPTNQAVSYDEVPSQEGGGVATPGLPVRWEVTEGLQRPESAYYDAQSGFIFLSQVGDGGGAAKDGDGFISKLTADGEMVDLKWITAGLSSPKGLRSHAGMLWVSDIDQIVCIDIAKGEVVQQLPVADAEFLNDVAIDDDGVVYVSDMLTSKIHRVRDGKVELFAEGDDLEWPNGLLVVDDQLIVGGWGKPGEGFVTETPGRLFRLNRADAEKTLITPEPCANLDGIELDGSGGYVASDWISGRIMRIGDDGKIETLLQLKQGTADIGVMHEQQLLLLPQMLENKLTAYDLSSLSSPE